MSNETTIVGPYTLDLSGHWVMTNIGIYREVEHFDLPSQAKIVCEELNTAYAAGQASREQWINVKDQRPQAYEWVLVYGDTGDVGDFPFDIGRIISGEWKCLGWDYPVTHWMLLPPSPPNK